VSVTVTNLILGPGTLYTGAFGAVEPLDTAVNLAPPSSAWTDVGGTLNGVTLSVDQTYTELQVDQLVDSIGRRLTKREFTITTQLAEPTLTNLSLSLNGATTTSGAITSGGTYQTLEPLFATSATQPTYIALCLDGYAPASFRRRVILRRSLSTAKVDTTMDKSKQTVFTTTFNGHYVSSAIAPIHIVDELT
jgi:hypothetical protein